MENQNTKLDPLQSPPPSDQELLKRQFKIGDPEALPNVTSQLPPDYKDAEIEFWYNVRPPSGDLKDRAYTWCAHDGRATHWKGYVMKAKDSGLRFLVGSNCGKKLFGLDFELVERDFNTIRKRQNYLVRWLHVKEALPDAVGALKLIIKSSAVAQFDNARSCLIKDMPELYGRLNLAVARNQGRLTIGERVRDYVSEQNRQDKYEGEDQGLEQAKAEMTTTQFKSHRKAYNLQKKRRETKPIYKTVEKEVGRIGDFAPVWQQPSLKRALSSSIRDFDQLLSDMNSLTTEDVSNSELSKMLKRAKEYLAKVESDLQRISLLRDFLKFQNLNTVLTWTASLSLDGKYETRGEALIYTNSSGDSHHMSVSRDLRMPRIAQLENLKVAMSRAN